MVRKGDWKLILYAGHPPQLFNLFEDPREVQDRSGAPETETIQAELEAELRKILDPDEINALAFADQRSRIDQLGGEDAIRAKTEIGFTPAPKQ